MVGLLSLAILAALFVVSIASYVVMLKLGVQWVRAKRATYRRALAATMLVFVCYFAAFAGDRFITAAFQKAPEIGTIFTLVIGLISAVLIPLGVITILFRISPGRAFLAWLWPFFASLGVLCLLLLIARPFLVEAFQVPSNAMAPTLLGRHHRSVCLDCGATCYCSVPAEPRFRNRVLTERRAVGADGPYHMICDRFHASEQKTVPPAIYDGDKFLVAKFVKRRRWDLLVFRFPQDPQTLYVKRLVGLPGETITIENGVVHADVRPLPLPADLQGQTYLSELPYQRSELWGTADRPAKLDADEYFVLGDFSASSYDSRMWRDGAPGHHAYAVPQSHIVGVVSAIYWPPNRWRIFR